MFFMGKDNLSKKIDKLNENLEKSSLIELSYILSNKKEFIKRNFIAGLIRGVGIGIGVTIVTAIIIIILQRLVRLNIPIIGVFIADIIRIVNSNINY